MDADAIIQHLDLTPHPEGGYFRETYRCEESIAQSALPDRYSGSRSVSTTIFFLLKGTQHSAFHRLASDEIWYYNQGDPVAIHLIDNDGTYKLITLGPDIADGQQFQAVIPAGTWFGANVSSASGFVLVSCSVAPGFDFSDFEIANRKALITYFPQHAEIITELTSES